MNLLLTAANASRSVTNFLGLSKRESIKGLPLGTSDNSDTGEIGVKVIGISGFTTPAATTVTPHFVNVGANANSTIPSGAKGWTFTLITGTGTLGGIVITNGFSDGDTGTTAAAIAYTTGANSSGYLRYNT